PGKLLEWANEAGPASALLMQRILSRSPFPEQAAWRSGRGLKRVRHAPPVEICPTIGTTKLGESSAASPAQPAQAPPQPPRMAPPTPPASRAVTRARPSLGAAAITTAERLNWTTIVVGPPTRATAANRF